MCFTRDMFSSLFTLTAFEDLAVADHGLIYPNGILSNTETVLFALQWIPRRAPLSCVNA